MNELVNDSSAMLFVYARARSGRVGRARRSRLEIARTTLRGPVDDPRPASPKYSLTHNPFSDYDTGHQLLRIWFVTLCLYDT